MATLKEHQAAMVDLLANGSGIPASASRLAHAMFDILGKMLDGTDPVHESMERFLREESTTPGLNDKALSKPQKALKTDSPARWPTPAEQRVKELENTIKQLKANNAKLRKQIAESAPAVDLWNRWSATPPEQACCRKEDTQVCEHEWAALTNAHTLECINCGVKKSDIAISVTADLIGQRDELIKILAFYGVTDLDKARAAYSKEDTQVCEHDYQVGNGGFYWCTKCKGIRK